MWRKATVRERGKMAAGAGLRVLVGIANGSTENYVKCDPSRAEAERRGTSREFRLI